MISRRFFLKALAALAAAPAVSTAETIVPYILPDVMESQMLIRSAHGTLLVTMPLVWERRAGGWRARGDTVTIDQSGIASEAEWRLPNGTILRGTVGPDEWYDVRVNTACFTLGGFFSLEGFIETS